MLKSVLLVLVVLIVGCVVVVAVQPSEFRVERSTTIAAPASVVFAQVNDFHNWDAWSPWAKLDPNCKYSFEGPPAGTGAILAWAGNNEVGEGRMTITESQPPELIRIKLDFVKPFENSANVQFTFKPQGDQTVVTWTMSGPNTFVGKAMHLVMNMDKMIGGDFEKGLAQLKTVAENITGK